MRRKIVRIDEEKCAGCGQCVTACVEGAIELVDGKARLVSESYCDGLGACLGECPEGAITIEERDAPPFDEEATKKHMSAAAAHAARPHAGTGHACPGSMAMVIERPHAGGEESAADIHSKLGQWPVQLTLVPPDAPYFRDADLLLVADCVPFAFADFHRKFLSGNAVVVGCPKLDDADFYTEKLAEILKRSSVRSLTAIHMEVPCCFGLRRIAEEALSASGKDILLRDVTVGIRGDVVSDEG